MQRMLDSDVVGLVFNRLTVMAVTGRTPARKRLVQCRCECGGSTVVCLSDLRNSHIRSCGCLLKEKSAERMKKIRHLGQGNRLRHGQSLEPEYYVWKTMKVRCRNPKSKGYRRYGARGITVCERWLSFDVFFTDMGKRPSPKHQLDRIDNDGPYSPENCRWATPQQQGRNRSTNRLITFNGETLTATEWGERRGLARGTIAKRLRAGWSLERALLEPNRPQCDRIPNQRNHS